MGAASWTAWTSRSSPAASAKNRWIERWAKTPPASDVVAQVDDAARTLGFHIVARRRERRAASRVHGPDDEARPLAHLVVDPPDVLADEAERHEDHPEQQEQDDDERRHQAQPGAD